MTQEQLAEIIAKDNAAEVIDRLTTITAMREAAAQLCENKAAVAEKLSAASSDRLADFLSAQAAAHREDAAAIRVLSLPSTQPNVTDESHTDNYVVGSNNGYGFYLQATSSTCRSEAEIRARIASLERDYEANSLPTYAGRIAELRWVLNERDTNGIRAEF